MLTRKYALSKIRAGKAYRDGIICTTDGQLVWRIRTGIDVFHPCGTKDTYPASEAEIKTYQAGKHAEYIKANPLY